MDVSATLFAAHIDDKAPVIDLHQADSVAGALILLDQQLHQLYLADESYCRIIFGVGEEGVLASAVVDALKENSVVVGWEIEEHGGSCVVAFAQ